MAAAAVNRDLSKERKAATFDAEKLTEFLYGGKEALRRRRYLQNIVTQDKYLQSLKPWWNRSREKYSITVERSIYVTKLLRDLNITDPKEQDIIFESACPFESSSFSVHYTMFIPTIEKQGTIEQKKKYLEPARKLQLIGTYAQTELGHGTFLRGLETTATNDSNTEEFVIHSPTLTATKYWPGNLGKTTTHVALMAQLYTKGQCYGMHTFIVQIRSLEDHTPLPGVTVGDIGNKLGYDSMDNGYLRFDNYRVPRDAMLMKHAKVERDGTYKPPISMKVTYGTMVGVRAELVGFSADCLARACVIATRYSAVRRQTEIRPGGEEPQILDYQTQQDKLFPLIALSYALLFTGNFMMKEYRRISKKIEGGDLDELQVLHGLSSGMKAFSSDIASDGIDLLRRACGGHGYMHASGIPKIWTIATTACTVEGENTVMYLQCGRYLIKCYEMTVRGETLPGAMQYLNKMVKQKSLINDQLDITDLVEAFEHAAARLVRKAALRVQSLMKNGVAEEDARNQSGVLLVNAAKAHSRAFTVRTFAEFVERSVTDPDSFKVMHTLCKLFAAHGIVTNMGDFLQSTIRNVNELYTELRPNAVALVDAFDYPDHVLQSCLGRFDGNVYEALYEYAKQSPLNKNDVLDSYYSTLRPLIREKLFSSTAMSKL